MAYNDDVTFTKGDFSVSIWTTKPTENFKNELKVIAPVSAPATQENTPEPATVVDLLRTIHTFVIGGNITKTSEKTAKQVKDDLVSIMKGAGVSGATPVTMAYDGDSILGFIKDLVIVKFPSDNAALTANYAGEDAAEYQVTITFVEGTNV